MQKLLAQCCNLGQFLPLDDVSCFLLRYVVGIVFGAEHFLIFCVVLAHYLVSDVPSDVQVELEKREYEKKVLLEKMHHKKKLVT